MGMLQRIRERVADGRLALSRIVNRQDSEEVQRLNTELRAAAVELDANRANMDTAFQVVDAFVAEVELAAPEVNPVSEAIEAVDVQTEENAETETETQVEEETQEVGS